MPETIGDVKYSILEPTEFKERNPGWELLTEQTLATDSPLGSLGIKKLPDGRGVFIRSMNEGMEPGKGDADGNRSIGEYQKDNFESHSHAVTNLGFFQALLPNQGWGGAEMTQFNAGQGLRDIRSMIRNEPSGGNETRPRNIALYLYIKLS